MSLRLSSNQGNKLQAHIRRNDTEVRKQYRNLVTGKRINEAADDVGRVDQVEAFEQQIRGYSRAARNAYEGIHVARAGDSALMEASNIIESMRALAVQAANDTNSEGDRLKLHEGFSDLVDGLRHITKNTKIFNRRILGEEFLGQRLHVGMSAFESIDLDIKAFEPSRFPRMALRETEQMSHLALVSGELRLNDIGIRSTLTEDDQLSTSLNSASAIAKAAAINDFSKHTQVTAEVLGTRRTGVDEVRGGRLDVGSELFVNGVRFSGIDVGIEADDDLMFALNERRHETGVFASKDRDNRLILTAEDGRNIEIETRGNAHVITGLRAQSGTDITFGTLKLTSDETIFVTDRDGNGAAAKVGLAHNDIVGKALHRALTTLDVRTRESANRTIESLDKALEDLLEARAYFGGLENRLGSTVSRLNLAGQNAYKGKSTMVDTDYLAETAALARNQVLRESYTLMLKQSNRLPGRILELL